MLTESLASLYYVALAGADRQRDRALFGALRALLRTRPAGKRGAHPRLIYGKLGALGTSTSSRSSLRTSTPRASRAALERFELGDPAGGLELSERAVRLGKPSWRLVSNAIAMAVHAHPRKLPHAVLARWMKRAPRRGTHAGYWENVACAQVRLGRHASARVAAGAVELATTVRRSPAMPRSRVAAQAARLQGAGPARRLIGPGGRFSTLLGRTPAAKPALVDQPGHQLLVLPQASPGCEEADRGAADPDLR